METWIASQADRKMFVISRECLELCPFNLQKRAKHLVLVIICNGLNICVEKFTDINYILGVSIGICLNLS